MIALVVEIFLEFILELFVELFVDVLAHGASSRVPWIRRAVNTFLTAVIYFGVGLFAGFVSLWFFPKAFIRSETLHGISLLITPALAGLAMAAIGTIRERQGKVVIRLESFSYGFLLAFAMALIRFWYTQ